MLMDRTDHVPHGVLQASQEHLLSSISEVPAAARGSCLAASPAATTDTGHYSVVHQGEEECVSSIFFVIFY